MKKIYISVLSCFFIATAWSQSSSLVISQVYGGGGNAGATYTHDYVELFNPTNTTITFSNWSIQYAATAGAFTAGSSTTISGSIPAGKYFLVQLATGGAVGASLPTPDASNAAVNMSAANGKVALVNNTTALGTLTCPFSNSAIIDLVGFGTANVSEGCATAPAGTNANGIFRKNNGCTDTDNNGSDFLTQVASARNSSSAANLCAGSCTTPSQKSSLLRLAKSTSSSLSLLFTRGNGSGAIVLCKQGSLVNAAPVNGTTYSANAAFGSGSQIGTGNFVVHNTTFSNVVGFTVSNLVSGTKYYFSVFEYNDPGKCYTSTGLVDSFTVGATIFKPGDMVFIGWDANANAGEDELYLMNMVDITKGTKFSIVNSRFETGAAANVRTNRWGGGGSDPFQDPDKQDFEYVGASTIAKGSVISMESNSTSGFTNFKINGVSVPASDFSAKTGTSNFLSVTGTDADQLYIVQGTFIPFGTATVDRYNLLNGLVIHGFTSRTPWVPLTSAVSNANTGGTTRESRIPPDILCINTEFPSSVNSYANYTRATGQSGTKAQMLGRLKNIANWTTGAGTVGVDDVLAGDAVFGSSTYTISGSTADGSWNGTVSSDWFDCSNWEGLHVPDSNSLVYINPIVPASNNCDINTSASAKAVEYSNIARADSLFVLPNAVLSLAGTGSQKIYAEEGIDISLNGTFQFESNANALTDTLFLHGSLKDNDNTGKGLLSGSGTVQLNDSRFTATFASLTKPVGSALLFNNLVMNNSRSVDVKDSTRISNNFNLKNGYLNISGADARLTLKANTGITSAVNVYAQTNKGYQSSFVNGKMFYETDASTVNVPFPIGKITSTDTLFAPAELTKTNSTVAIYNAEYFATAYTDLTVDPGQLHHVSGVEHWFLNADVSNANAQVTLSWRPKSQVGDGSNNPVALDSLMVAHYFDDDGGGGNPSLWHVDGGSNVIMTKNPTASFNYGLITTISSIGSFSPFTLGTRGTYNLLPLKLLSLEARPGDRSVEIRWTTSEEREMNYYEVEKSADGLHFSKTGTVFSVNSIPLHIYSIVDNQPVEGWNYYRLRVVDRQQHPYYTPVVKTLMGKAGTVRVYPNPAEKEIKIILPSRSTTDISIVNYAGQVVNKVRTDQLSLTINIETLSPGIYFVYIRNSRQAIVQSFNKQ